jgi:hypothetical protein
MLDKPTNSGLLLKYEGGKKPSNPTTCWPVSRPAEEENGKNKPESGL